ncbi:hypothetical protein, partial [Streptococcus sobrinus]|uniref:hypothetical protein n=2 Tax=Streptococcus sobrinus TaxID=1310 RepID=UPI00051583E3
VGPITCMSRDKDFATSQINHCVKLFNVEKSNEVRLFRANLLLKNQVLGVGSIVLLLNHTGLKSKVPLSLHIIR